MIGGSLTTESSAYGARCASVRRCGGDGRSSPLAPMPPPSTTGTCGGRGRAVRADARGEQTDLLALALDEQPRGGVARRCDLRAASGTRDPIHDGLSRPRVQCEHDRRAHRAAPGPAQQRLAAVGLPRPSSARRRTQRISSASRSRRPSRRRCGRARGSARGRASALTTAVEAGAALPPRPRRAGRCRPQQREHVVLTTDARPRQRGSAPRARRRAPSRSIAVGSSPACHDVGRRDGRLRPASRGRRSTATGGDAHRSRGDPGPPTQHLARWRQHGGVILLPPPSTGPRRSARAHQGGPRRVLAVARHERVGQGPGHVVLSHERVREQRLERRGRGRRGSPPPGEVPRTP